MTSLNTCAGDVLPRRIRQVRVNHVTYDPLTALDPRTDSYYKEVIRNSHLVLLNEDLV